MPCVVQTTPKEWTIKWYDGISETYRILPNGVLLDKHGGRWIIYSRKGEIELDHKNGNRILIAY